MTSEDAPVSQPLPAQLDERTVEVIAQGAIMPFSQVSLPALARLQDDLPAFGKAYLRIVGVSAALAFPAIIGFALLPPDAVTLLDGDRWAESGKIAQVLGLMAVPFTINYFAGPALAALAAIGRSGDRAMAKIAVLQLTLTIVLSLLAAPFALTAIAAAYVLRAHLTLPVQMAAFKRYSGAGYGALLGAIASPLLMALVMSGCLLALDHVAGARFQSRGIFLLLMVCTGATVYAGSMLLFACSLVFQQIRDIRRLVPGSAKLCGADA